MAKILFRLGVGIMIIATAAALVLLLLFVSSKKRLKTQLENEYGKKRHG